MRPEYGVAEIAVFIVSLLACVILLVALIAGWVRRRSSWQLTRNTITAAAASLVPACTVVHVALGAIVVVFAVGTYVLYVWMGRRKPENVISWNALMGKNL